MVQGADRDTHRDAGVGGCKFLFGVSLLGVPVSPGTVALTCWEVKESHNTTGEKNSAMDGQGDGRVRIGCGNGVHVKGSEDSDGVGG